MPHRLTIAFAGPLVVLLCSIRPALGVPVTYEVWYDAGLQETTLLNDPSSESAAFAWMRIGPERWEPIWVMPGDKVVVRGPGVINRPRAAPAPFRYGHLNPPPKGFYHVAFLGAGNPQWRPVAGGPGFGLGWMAIPPVCNNIGQVDQNNDGKVDVNVCFNLRWPKAMAVPPFRLTSCEIEGLTDMTADPDDYALVTAFSALGAGPEQGYPVGDYLPNQALVGIFDGGLRISTDTDSFLSAFTENLGTGCHRQIPEPSVATGVVLGLLSLCGTCLSRQRHWAGRRSATSRGAATR